MNCPECKNKESVVGECVKCDSVIDLDKMVLIPGDIAEHLIQVVAESAESGGCEICEKFLKLMNQ
jgi:hypothetical protein